MLVCGEEDYEIKAAISMCVCVCVQGGGGGSVSPWFNVLMMVVAK